MLKFDFNLRYSVPYKATKKTLKKSRYIFDTFALPKMVLRKICYDACKDNLKNIGFSFNGFNLTKYSLEQLLDKSSPYFTVSFLVSSAEKTFYPYIYPYGKSKLNELKRYYTDEAIQDTGSYDYSNLVSFSGDWPLKQIQARRQHPQ